jgi:hypothetical protein
MTADERVRDDMANGAAMAAFLAAGIGVLVLGLIVVIHEIGGVAIPALYAPAGGASGRTALAVVIWLIVWAALHSVWRRREMQAGRVAGATFVLVVLGLIFAFPPIWKLF